MPFALVANQLQALGPAVRTKANKYDICQKVQALALYSAGVKIPNITASTGVTQRSFYNILSTAKARGFDPSAKGRILSEYCEDGKRSGRPRNITAEDEATVLDFIAKDRAGRESSSEVIAYNCNISQSSCLRILHKHGKNSVKPTTKPGLNDAQRRARYQFCLAHKDWTLEDWKDVIWSDETSVCLSQRRGTVRTWRGPNEAYEPTVIRRRWKGFSEMLFWGCFSYEKRGPCHIWKPETAAMKKASSLELEELNRVIEPVAKTQWELEKGVERLGLRNRPGKRPKWSFTKATGKLVREGSGGVDWYRYWKEVLVPKLIPFAQECLKDRPKTIVQEDNAPAHSHKHQITIYNLYEIARLVWPGNSPDLNAIEKAWAYLKRVTTALGAANTKQELIQRWERAWAQIPQELIQQWIEGIVHNIQEVLRLEGGNEYKEGRSTARSWAGRRLKGELSTHMYLQAARNAMNSDDWEDIKDERLRHDQTDQQDQGSLQQDLVYRIYHTNILNSMNTGAP